MWWTGPLTPTLPGSHCSRFGFNFVINNICFENNKYLTFLSPVLGGRGEGAGEVLRPPGGPTGGGGGGRAGRKGRGAAVGGLQAAQGPVQAADGLERDL